LFQIIVSDQDAEVEVDEVEVEVEVDEVVIGTVDSVDAAVAADSDHTSRHV
jgi:hypothetical protein